MTDIAQLGIAVDSRQVKDATKDLDKLTEASKETEKATEDLTAKKVAQGVVMGGFAKDAIEQASKALYRMTFGAIDAADAINTLTIKTGISANILTSYQHAAAMSNVSNEALANGLKMLNKTIADSNGELESFGIATRDSSGNMIAANVVFEQVADKIASMSNATEQAALAEIAFKRAGDDLLPVLKEGSAGLEKFRLEANLMGTAISDDFAQQAAQFSDNLDTIGLMAKAAANSIAGFLLPALNGLADLILVTNQERAKAFKIELANLTEEGVIRTEWQRQRIAFLNEEISKLDAVARAEQARSALAGAAKLGDIRDARDRAGDVATGKAPKPERATGGAVSIAERDLSGFSDAGDRALAAAEWEAFKINSQQEADDAEFAAIQSQFSRLADEEESFRAWQRELDDLSNEDRLAMEEEFYQKRLAFSKQATSEQMAFTMGALAQGLAYSAQHNRKAFEAQKIFALSEAAINGYNGAVKTWNSYPYPWNIPMTAAHVAGTAGLISSINSRSFGGGGGGAAMPSGGTSAPAGVLPQVSTPPVITGGSQGTTIAPIARQVNLSITGDSFSYNDIANKLIPMINEAVGNGIELRVTAP